MDYKEKYEEIFDKLNTLLDNCRKQGHIVARVEDIESIFPELKESEDERIRKELIKNFKLLNGKQFKGQKWGVYEELLIDNVLAWLEKQGENIDRDKLAKGMLSGVATTIMQFLDANLAEGNMCLSNMECEDLENAVRNADWMKVYRYMKKKLEKQGEPQDESALEAQYKKGWDDAMHKLPKEVDSQIWQIANNSAKTWEESFAILTATQRGYDRGKRDAAKEQKPVEWSEDDEEAIALITTAVMDETRLDNEGKYIVHSWLKSLKDKINTKQGE